MQPVKSCVQIFLARPLPVALPPIIAGHHSGRYDKEKVGGGLPLLVALVYPTPMHEQSHHRLAKSYLARNTKTVMDRT